MKKLIAVATLVLLSLTGLANENDECFSLSLDGKKISYIVLYQNDWDHQQDGLPAPTINVRVFNFQNTEMIIGSTYDQNIVNQWVGQPVFPQQYYSATHKLLFSESNLQGKKTNYEIKLVGLAQDLGGGASILRGQSELKIDGKVVLYPNLKTINRCPHPTDLNEIKEIESLL